MPYTSVQDALLPGDYRARGGGGGRKRRAYAQARRTQITKDETFVQSLIDEGTVCPPAETSGRHPGWAGAGADAVTPTLSGNLAV
jgi:hypothetical protein